MLLLLRTRRQRLPTKDNANVCASQGVHFIPLVAETTGTWDATAERVLRTISRPGNTHALLLQELSITIRAHRARAALQQRTELWSHKTESQRQAAVLLEQ